MIKRSVILRILPKSRRGSPTLEKIWSNNIFFKKIVSFGWKVTEKCKVIISFYHLRYILHYSIDRKPTDTNINILYIVDIKYTE